MPAFAGMSGGKDMAKSTPATVALQKAGAAFTLHEYDYDPNAERIGMQAAEALGVDPARLLKTLMAKAGNETVCVLVPSDREVSLKKLAAAAGAKDAAMLPPAQAERITGYHVGGISPFGQKKRVRVFVAQEARLHDTVIVNGGRRGLQIELVPADLLRVLDAKASELCA
jgi:Cys-tRNA(Pro)/Cys-tRNA(Cys) deacylase